MDIQALTQVPAECMCDAGAERDVWSKKKEPAPADAQCHWGARSGWTVARAFVRKFILS